MATLPRKSAGHIPSLDGVRAISFFLVFLSHIGYGDRFPGGFGVTVFFFLSGYLITTLMRVEFEATGAVNLGHFYLRRALRILPAFYLILFAATLATIWLKPGTLSVSSLVARCLQYTNYWSIAHGENGEPLGTGVYWSLAVEEHFYLLFPLLYLFMQRFHLTRQQQALALWALCALVLVWRCVLVFDYHVATDRTYLATDTRLDSILYGCALAIFGNPVLDEPIGSDLLWKYGLIPISLAVLVACLLLRSDIFRETWRYSLQGMSLTVMFVAAIRYSNWAPFRWLNMRPVAFLGVLSYSLYLVHYAVIFVVQRLMSEAGVWAQFVASFAVSLAIAWTIYLLVEKPCARLRKRLTTPIRGSAASRSSSVTDPARAQDAGSIGD